MNKKVLLLAAILSLSVSAYADESGYVRTGIKAGYKENAWNNELNGTDDNLSFAEWTLAEGWFKGSNWKGFGVGYSAKKSFNEDNNSDGAMKIELSPEYGKSTKFGYVSGQITFAEEKWGSMSSGSDTIKPKVSATVNLTPKSRLEMKALYAYTQATPVATKEKYNTWSDSNSLQIWKEKTTNTDDGKSQWAEAEVQYKYELFGGTAGVGVYYGTNIKDKYTTTTTGAKYNGWGGPYNETTTTSEELSANDNYYQINYLVNYAKYITPIKLYASIYGEFDNFTYKYDTNSYGKKDVQAYQVGLYLSRNFSNGFGLDLEAVRKADLTKYTAWYADGSHELKLKTENSVAIGVKYNF